MKTDARFRSLGSGVATRSLGWGQGIARLFATAALLSPCSAFAQSTERPNSEGDGDIVVTANRREAKLIDTPISVTVLNSDVLKAINADQFSDYARLVPGLSYSDSGPGNKRYALRGLQSAGEPEVALYYDEIPVSGVPGGSLDTGDSQPDIKLWDVDRVEVVRGPQGTLYGNGSMGGAIRIISKRPVLDAIDAAARGSIGFTSGGAPSWGAAAMINLPIAKDVIGIRLTAYDRREGGWIDDISRADIALSQIARSNFNTERTYGGRASISIQPTTAWNITGIAYYQDMNTTAFDLYPAFATQDDRYVSKAYVREPWRDKIFMANVISTNDFGWADLTATGSYQHRTLHRVVDTTRFLVTGVYGCTELNYDKTCFTPSTLPAAGYSDEAVTAWSGEIRFVSKTKGPLQWTLGTSLQDSRTWRRSQVAPVDANGQVNVDPATGNAVGRLFERDNSDSFDQYAVFGEASYRVTNALTGIVGLRYFHSDRTDQQVLVQQFFPGSPVGAQPFQRFKEGKLFQKYELSYRLGSGLVYVEAAQGFRAGGPNYPGGFALSAPPYSSDSVWDYEAGWKFELLQKRLFWSGAIFQIRWNNLQQLVPTQLFNYIANAGKARSDGFETELSYKPLASLTLGGGVAYNNARLIGPQPVQTNPAMQLFAGDKLANVPDWSANVSATYERKLANGYSASARVDASYQSGRADLVATLNPAYFEIGSSTLVNMHLDLDSHRRWRVGIDVENALDAYAPLSARALDSNFAKTVTAARPRTITLSFDVSY